MERRRRSRRRNEKDESGSNACKRCRKKRDEGEVHGADGNQRDKGRNKGMQRGQKAKVTIWACKRWIEFDIGMKGIGLKGMGSVRLHCIQTVESDALIVCREHNVPARASICLACTRHIVHVWKKEWIEKINSEDRTTWERISYKIWSIPFCVRIFSFFLD